MRKSANKTILSRLVLLQVLVMVFMLSACSSSQDETPVPRIKAFPRIESYGSDYRMVDSLPVCFEANAKADISIRRKDMGYAIDIAYPRYRAAIFVTIFALPDDDEAELADMMRLRQRRISLNLGDTPFKVDKSTNSTGMKIQVVRAESAVPTPVQLLATDKHRRIVSATAFVDFCPSTTATDSLAPIIDALYADMTRIAATLR